MFTIVVRNTRNRSRFLGRLRWVKSEKRARLFPSSQAAIIHCLENDVSDAEVVVRFDSKAPAVSIRLPKELPSPDAGEEWMGQDEGR